MAAGQLREVCDVGNKGDYGQHVRLDSTLVTEIRAGRLGQNLQEMLVAVRAPGFSFMLLSRSCKTIEFSTYLQGPTDTPYQEGVFQLSINVPEQYPLVPPQVRFVTKIFHPNVHFKVLFPQTCSIFHLSNILA